MTHPSTPSRTIVPGGSGHTLLRRVMKVRTDVREIERIVLVDRPDLRITLRDTGPDGTPPETVTGDTAIHLLWALGDDTAHLTIGDRETPFAPGDLVLLPAGTTWHASSSLILCEIAGMATGQYRIEGPTHGTDTFHGYNRETTFPAPPGLAIARWKLTQPLALPAADHNRYVVNLTTPIALAWPAGTDLLGPGECRHLPPSTGPVTLIPDGLGYALIVDALATSP